jgi:hypothetical protein
MMKKKKTTQAGLHLPQTPNNVDRVSQAENATSSPMSA